jgi:hypothetical protein
MALDLSALESWLWDAACAIRGPLDAPKFKDYILPLVFLKRLSDVFEDELERLGQRFGGREIAERIGVRDRLREIHLRPMRRKWASISTRGRLTLNTELLVQTAEFRRQVIVHELVHLKLGTGLHNKLFRALVRAYLAQATSPPPSRR